MATKKFESYEELFNPMAEFAVKNGMTKYHSDLMLDAVEIYEMAEEGKPFEKMFAARSTNCGTDFYIPSIFKDLEKHGIFNPDRPKAIVKYDGEFFYFITED